MPKKSTSHMIELHGVHCSNKGAHLMMLAILQYFRNRWPGLRFAVAPRDSYLERAQLGLYQRLVITQLPHALTDRAGSLLPASFRQKYGLVVDKEIDAVLDAAGFNYSDQWGPEKTEMMMRRYTQLKKMGKKIILLPQALGPFRQERTRRAFVGLAESAHLIFARDEQSYDYAVEAVGRDPKIKKAPDFTNLLHFPGAEQAAPDGKAICALVPNVRILDKTDEQSRKGYVPLLAEAALLAKEKGLKPVFVIFQRGDEAIAEQVNDLLPFACEIIQDEDPLVLREFLARPALVIGSRFHALISSLSQGVPSIGLGWSHKYEALFNDYQTPDLLLNSQNMHDKLGEKLDCLLSPATRAPVVERIQAAGSLEKEKTQAMWSEVAAVLALD